MEKRLKQREVTAAHSTRRTTTKRISMGEAVDGDALVDTTISMIEALPVDELARIREALEKRLVMKGNVDEDGIPVVPDGELTAAILDEKKKHSRLATETNARIFYEEMVHTIFVKFGRAVPPFRLFKEKRLLRTVLFSLESKIKYGFRQRSKPPMSWERKKLFKLYAEVTADMVGKRRNAVKHINVRQMLDACPSFWEWVDTEFPFYVQSGIFHLALCTPEQIPDDEWDALYAEQEHEDDSMPESIKHDKGAGVSVFLDPDFEDAPLYENRTAGDGIPFTERPRPPVSSELRAHIERGKRYSMWKEQHDIRTFKRKHGYSRKQTVKERE